MQFHSRWAAAALLISVLSASSVANAALISRLGGLAYYDTAANVTWLADANYAETSGYSATGAMDWSTANAWAASLNIGGVTGWQLPNTVQPDPSCSSQVSGVSWGYNCTGSPLGELFYNELGGVAGSSIITTHNGNYNLFSHVQSVGYWSATEYLPGDPNAWSFSFNNGFQGSNPKTYYPLFAWAVHAGDVGAVPVPAAAWLFGSGLLGLIGVARRTAA